MESTDKALWERLETQEKDRLYYYIKLGVRGKVVGHGHNGGLGEQGGLMALVRWGYNP